MILELLAEQLEAMGYGTRGTDLFIYNMPSSVVNGMVIINNTPTSIDKYAMHRKGAFQIIARGEDAAETRKVMEQLIAELRTEGLDLGDVYFYHITPQHEPFVFPRSGSDQIEVSVNFDFAYATVE